MQTQIDNAMRVSVLVPVYNAARYIERCARSLLSQSYPHIEYIFVDDGSTDDSIDRLHDIMAQYPERRVTLRRNATNSGIACVRNQLLELATGDYVYFVDSDDYIVPNAITTLVNTAQETGADIVRCQYFEEKGTSSVTVANNAFSSKMQLLADAVRGSRTVDSLWKLFIRRTLFTLNSLRFAKGINVCEDYVMSVKLFYYARLVVDLPQPLYHYCVSSNPQSLTKDTPTAIRDRDKAIDCVVDFLKEKDIYAQLANDVNIRVLICKQGYLLNPHCFNLQRYMTFHPEANSAYRQLPYARRERLLFWLAEHHLSLPLRILHTLRRLKEQ